MDFFNRARELLFLLCLLLLVPQPSQVLVARVIVARRGRVKSLLTASGYRARPLRSCAREGREGVRCMARRASTQAWAIHGGLEAQGTCGGGITSARCGGGEGGGR